MNQRELQRMLDKIAGARISKNWSRNSNSCCAIKQKLNHTKKQIKKNEFEWFSCRSSVENGR